MTIDCTHSPRCQHDGEDLAKLLRALLDAHELELNASPLAHGSAGRVEINVNLTTHRLDLKVMVKAA